MKLDDILKAFAHVPPGSEPRVSCADRRPSHKGLPTPHPRSRWEQRTAEPHANGTTTEGAR